MDWRDAFNVAILVAGTVGGWALRTIWDAVSSLRDTVSELERSLPETSARRYDMKDLMQTVVARFDRLEEKVDRLAVR